MAASKKGQAESVLWIVRLLLMTVAVVVVAFIVSYYANRDVDASVIASNSYLYRIYYSNTIMYADAHTQRVYPGIIDLSKFTPDVLDKTFQERAKSGVARISSKLTLHDGTTTYDLYNDKQTYDQFFPFAQNNIPGPGGATMLNETWPVTIKDGNQERAGTLEIIIVRPNS